MKPQMSHTTLKVLKCFMERPSDGLFGWEIAKASGVLTGSLYPILARLEAYGWLVSHWEDIAPQEAGRPRRRYYKLTTTGRKLASNAFNELGLERR